MESNQSYSREELAVTLHDSPMLSSSDTISVAAFKQNSPLEDTDIAEWFTPTALHVGVEVPIITGLC